MSTSDELAKILERTGASVSSAFGCLDWNKITYIDKSEEEVFIEFDDKFAMNIYIKWGWGKQGKNPVPVPRAKFDVGHFEQEGEDTCFVVDSSHDDMWSAIKAIMLLPWEMKAEEAISQVRCGGGR